MANFVPVPGAWHGGWCWRRVADILERQGHKVVTPTLTGLGERSREGRAQPRERVRIPEHSREVRMTVRPPECSEERVAR